jgi:hypothetical protein
VVESVPSCEGVIDVGSRGMLIAEMMRMALGRGLGLLLCYSWPQYQSLYNETGQIKCISTAVSLHSTSSFRTSVTVSLALSSLLLIAASHITHTRVMHLAIWYFLHDSFRTPDLLEEARAICDWKRLEVSLDFSNPDSVDTFHDL